MPRLSRAGAALSIGLVFAVAACSSSPSGSSATTGDSSSPGTSASASAPGDSSAAGSPGGSLVIGSYVIPSFDLSQLKVAIPGLDSYKVAVIEKGVKQYETVVVEQPTLLKGITSYNDDGTVSDRYILNGTDTWQASGADGKFEKLPAGAGAQYLLLLDPTTLVAAYANLPWATGATNMGEDSKNGIASHHLHADSTTLGALAGIVPPGGAIDAWVADDGGYIVAMEVTENNAVTFQIEVSNVNDPANVVTVPAS